MSIYISIAAVLALSAAVVAKGTATIRQHQQPWPIKVPSISACCASTAFSDSSSRSNRSMELAKCVAAVVPLPTVSAAAGGVVVVTMAVAGTGPHRIGDVRTFSGYQSAVVASYAEHHGYQFLSVNDTNLQQFVQGEPSATEPSIGFEEVDERWYKIHLLLQAMDRWAAAATAFVWIDADAIVLDFSLSVEELLTAHPTANIIASADIRQGLINTGLLVLRNSEWTKNFLLQWLSIADTKTVCDQIAFDQVYRQRVALGESLSDDIAILPMNFLNSFPPAMLHQQDSDPVLHLMGETSAMRSAAFATAWNAICDAKDQGVLAPQLGLSRNKLLKIAREVYASELEILFGAANRSTSTADDFSQLSKVAHHYCDSFSDLSANGMVDKSRNRLVSEEVVIVRNSLLKLVDEKVVSLRAQLAQVDSNLQQKDSHSKDSLLSAKETRRLLSTQLVMMLKRAAECGNDLFGVTENFEDKLRIGQYVLDITQELYVSVAKQSKVVPLHMRALMYQNLGKLEYDAAVERRNKEASDSDALWSKHLHQAQQHLNNSVNIFNTSFFSVVNDDSTNCDIAYSKQLLAGVTCSLEDYQNGVRLWQETIALARSNTQGLDVGVHYDNLLLVMYNAGVCFYESNSLDLAMSILQQLLEMFEKSKHSTVVRINSDIELGAKELLGLVKDKLSHVKIEMESSAVGGASETEWEWEECHEGEADCEEVDLHLSQQKDATAETVATEQSVLPAEEEHDDETDEEWELELQEIQQRYAEQTATLMSMAEEDSLPNDVHHESYTYSKPTLQNTGKLGRMLSKLEISLDKLGQRFDLLQLEYFEVRGLVDSIRNEISTEN